MNARLLRPCSPCKRIRDALPMPQRYRRALEDFEARRLRQKEEKRARKAARADR